VFLRPLRPITSRMNIGARLSESSPCAMVLPPGSSRSARSGSTWIHCSSQVASAKRSIRSCVISIHSLAPISWPTADLISSNPSKIRISCARRLSRVLDLHLRDGLRNRKVRLRYGHHLRDADARRGLHQRDPAADETEDGKLGDHEIDGPRRGERQGALL